MPIFWHKNNLLNQESSLKACEAELQALSDRIARMKSDINFRRYQIATAERQRISEFCSDRYQQHMKDKV
jgi:hypothetical protein